MQTSQIMKTSVMTVFLTGCGLGLIRPTEAAVSQFDSLIDPCQNSQSCVDVWEFKCKDRFSHCAEVQVRDTSGNDNIEAIIMGSPKGNTPFVRGQAQSTVSPQSGYSAGARVCRAPDSHGPITTLVSITVPTQDKATDGYEIIFRCKDLSGNELADDDILLKKLQDAD